MTKFIQWNLRYWPMGVLLSILLSGVGVWKGKSLRLNSDLESLLPKHAKSVQDMEKIKPKAGGSYDFRVVLWGGSYEARLKAVEDFADDLKKRVHFVRSVRYRTPKNFFDKHQYELIPMDSLEALSLRVHKEKRKWAPITDPLGLEEVIEEESQRFDEPSVTAATEEETDQLDMAKDLLSRLEAMPALYQTEDRKFLAVRVLPYVETLDIQKNRQLLKEFRGMISSFGFQRYRSSH